MQLFYSPDIKDKHYTLSKEESKHCLMVLRKKKGDALFLVDGKGGYFEAIIVDDNPKSCQLEIISKNKEYGKNPVKIHLAVAPTKNIDRYEWFLEKSTEIGITEITPIICQNSERRVLKEDRMHKILVSAMKQSHRSYLPQLNPIISLHNFLKNQAHTNGFIAHCQADKKSHLIDLIVKNQNITLLIGPEGDFTSNEISQALDEGYTAVSLGKSRLRTETAAIVGCHIINLKNL